MSENNMWSITEKKQTTLTKGSKEIKSNNFRYHKVEKVINILGRGWMEYSYKGFMGGKNIIGAHNNLNESELSEKKSECKCHRVAPDYAADLSVQILDRGRNEKRKEDQLLDYVIVQCRPIY